MPAGGRTVEGRGGALSGGWGGGLSGWGEDLGQAVQELEGRQAERGAAPGIGSRQEIEDLVGAVVDEMKSVEGEGGPRTITNEPPESGAVGSLDADAPIQAEPTPVIPSEHVLSLMGLQEAVATEMPQDPGPDRVLEALQEFAGEGGGLAEVEAGFRSSWVRIRVIVDLSKSPSTTQRWKW